MSTLIVKIKDIEDIYVSDLTELLQLAAGSIFDSASDDEAPGDEAKAGSGSNSVATVTWKVQP